MSIKKQLKKIKENWLMTLLIIIIVGAILLGPGRLDEISLPSRVHGEAYEIAEESMAAYSKEATQKLSDENFALEITERKITKTATLNTQIERGTFQEMQNKVKNILSASGSYILSEKVNKFGTGKKRYNRGSYQIKVESGKYSSVISQLKGIGEIQEFNGNTKDITEKYVNVNLEIEAAKSRLAKYQEIYSESKDAEEKMKISDRMFQQERQIKYYEDSIKRMDTKTEYSEIHFTMQEKQSEYADLALVKLSQLMKSLVGSLNGLLNLVFVLLPYAIAMGIIIRIVKKVRKGKKKK